MARKPRKPDPREAIELRAGRRCEYCRAPQPATGIRYHLEHVFPESLGGTDDIGNLALACPTCNYYKSNHLLGKDEEGSPGRPLFNPRKDRWDEHFEFNRATLQLKGKTVQGSGTVKRLRMNDHMQIEARALWVELDLYP
jgi:5-methylcytosine-specific restriction endonuclease McrA